MQFQHYPLHALAFTEITQRESYCSYVVRIVLFPGCHFMAFMLEIQKEKKNCGTIIKISDDTCGHTATFLFSPFYHTKRNKET